MCLVVYLLELRLGMFSRFQRQHAIWILFCLIAAGIFIIYVISGLAGGRGNLLMPLDDVYIHFQYARQMAQGQPYIYNPGDPATSGATSFIYPFVLATGHLLGFQELNLGLWAMIIGALALLMSMWAMYHVCRHIGCRQWLAVLLPIWFGINGAVSWHFMSGMETGLMICFTLLTLYTLLSHQLHGFIIAATLLSLTRPEGSIMAAIATVAMAMQLRRDITQSDTKSIPHHWLLWLAIPVITAFIQPTVNYLITGTPSATGTQAKSILASIPPDWSVIIARITDNFATMWREFIMGDNAERNLQYLPILLPLFGLIGLARMLRVKQWRWVGLAIVGWFLATTAAVSTLDTAFWHFKRYQMPLMILFFPLAGYGIHWLLTRLNENSSLQNLRIMVISYIAIVIPLFSIPMLYTFWQFHLINVDYVYRQPYQMALWLRENTADNATVAVHDVGMMRYMGNRRTLDIVGLTTPGAAAYWRNGPGAVAEFLLREQPDYIASYGEGHGYGLGTLAETRLYANPLAIFTVNLDARANVALAADSQGIYQPDWSEADYPRQVVEGSAFNYTSGFRYADGVNVGDIASEQSHDYRWRNTTPQPGFATEIRDMQYGTNPIHLLDAARHINGEESFVIRDLNPDFDAMLITRVHMIHAGTIDIYVNDVFIDTRVITQIPGFWLDLATLIPAELVTETMTIRIVPHVGDGYYMPAYHRVEQGSYQPDPQPETTLASYQDGAFVLTNYFVRYQLFRGQRVIFTNFDWYSDGSSAGDYRFFMHLYDELDQPPIVQHDGYIGGHHLFGFGDSTPGNWLQGIRQDTMMLYVNDTPNGLYHVAIGFYNPQTSERLIPESDIYTVLPDGRLLLDDIEIYEFE